jgi:hypothetical protein
LVVMALAATALIEPAYQVLNLASSGEQLWAKAFVAVHVPAFNGVEPSLFRQYDFICSTTWSGTPRR